jgi:putative restriction endonuclease
VTKGVFLHRADSIYDDRPEIQYQFPRQYLARAHDLAGDWIIYCEPRRGGGGRGYFAMAGVQQIIEDPAAPGMHLALIEPGTYLDFERNVPFRTSEGRVERDVPNAQWAVRPASISDFNRILTLGFPEEEAVLPRVDTDLQAPLVPALADEQAPFVLDVSATASAITAPASSATAYFGNACSKPMTAAAPSPA